jgi:hypothetical protein
MLRVISLASGEQIEARRRHRRFVSGAAIALCFSLGILANCGGGGAGNGGAGGGTGGSGGGGGGGGNAIQIQRVEPSRVMLGVAIGGATLVGSNFTASSTVLFDGAAVQTVYENPSLQFTMPTTAWNVAQSHTVQVTDPTNGKSNVATFEVYAPQPGPALFNGQLTQYMSESLITNSLVSDLNGDGRADLVLVAPPSNSNPTQYVAVVRHGQADGTFSASSPLVSFPLDISPNMVLAGDFNGDGHTDLVLFGSQRESGIFFLPGFAQRWYWTLHRQWQWRPPVGFLLCAGPGWRFQPRWQVGFRLRSPRYWTIFHVLWQRRRDIRRAC